MPFGEGTSFGIGTLLRYTPGPPSIGVLSTIVASTNVMASVRSPKSSPRSLLTRKTTAPIPAASSAATRAAIGKVARNGRPNADVSVDVVYIPAPKYAP